jgi:septation ring formation regulator EzrA
MEQQKSIKYLQSQHDIVQTQLSQAQQQFSKVQQQIDELQNQLIVRNAYNHDMNARLNTIKYWGLRLWNRLRNRS